jgi:hypothetical protein
MGEAKRRPKNNLTSQIGFKNWIGDGPDPYLPEERTFVDKDHVSIDYDLMMTNYHNDVIEALATNDPSKLTRYDKMVILKTKGERVFPATDLNTLRTGLARSSPDFKLEVLKPMGITH